MRFFLNSTEIHNYEIVDAQHFIDYQFHTSNLSIYYQNDSKTFYTFVVSNFRRALQEEVNVEGINDMIYPVKHIYIMIVNIPGNRLDNGNPLVILPSLDMNVEGFYRIEVWKQKKYINQLPKTIMYSKKIHLEKDEYQTYHYLGIQYGPGWTDWDEYFTRLEDEDPELICFRFNTNDINFSEIEHYYLDKHKASYPNKDILFSVIDQLFVDWKIKSWEKSTSSSEKESIVIIGTITPLDDNHQYGELFQYLAMEVPIVLGKKVNLVQLTYLPDTFKVHFQAEDSSSQYKIYITPLTPKLYKLHQLLSS